MDEINKKEGIDCSLDEVLEYCKTSEIVVLPRKKNREFRYNAGIRDEAIKDYVRTLKKEYFYKKVDDTNPNHAGKLYIFERLVLEKYWCYIKLKINVSEGGNVVVVISFHDDETLQY